MMRRRPMFTAIAVLSLVIALAANTAIFSFARAIVLKTLPVAGAERLVILRHQDEMFHIENCCFPYAFFRELRKQDVGVLSYSAARRTRKIGGRSRGRGAKADSGAIPQGKRLGGAGRYRARNSVGFAELQAGSIAAVWIEARRRRHCRKRDGAADANGDC